MHDPGSRKSHSDIFDQLDLFSYDNGIETVVTIQPFLRHVDIGGFDDFRKLGGRDAIDGVPLPAFDFDEVQNPLLFSDDVDLTETRMKISVEDRIAAILQKIRRTRFAEISLFSTQ